jgi:hypothetical protein
MATLARPEHRHATGDERAVAAHCTDTHLVIDLSDGRSIATPLQWYPSLRVASPEQRNNWRLIGSGIGIHWPDLDEDLSVEGMLDGRPAVGWDR